MPLSTAAGVASRATCLVNAPHPQQLDAATKLRINSPVVKVLESLDIGRPPAQAFTPPADPVPAPRSPLGAGKAHFAQAVLFFPAVLTFLPLPRAALCLSFQLWDS